MRTAVHTVLCWLGLAIPLLFCSCHGQQHRQMRALLNEADSLNRAYAPLPSDTLLLEAADFFDRHGSANDRLRAHYLLGCSYRDMGDAPRAVDCYLDAAACADTTDEDCDFNKLSCVYSQMAGIYQKQLLLSKEIEAHHFACKYNYLAHDTLGALYEQKMSACAYILLQKPDSAESIIKDVIRKYQDSGHEQEALQASMIAMHIYAGQPERHEDLGVLINQIENRSILFDEHHELPPSRRQYYYYKGRYFEGTGQLDSAEYYYRKVFRQGMNYVDLVPMYKGLLNVFSLRHQADSIAKYNKLYCEANDSSIAIKDQELTAQLSFSYNYAAAQENAHKNERRAIIAQSLLFSFCVVSVLLLFAIIHAVNDYRKKRESEIIEIKKEQLRKEQSQQESFRRELDHQQKLCLSKEQELERMEKANDRVVQAIRQELADVSNEKNDALENYVRSEKTISEIKAQYEQDKTALKSEIEGLKAQIAALKMQQQFPDNLKRSKLLIGSAIVKSLNSFAEVPQRKITKRDIALLESTLKDTFPELLQAIKQSRRTSKTDRLAALLTSIGLRPAQIQRLTDLSPSQITNSKAKANKSLFDDNSAATLFSNISARYGICID